MTLDLATLAARRDRIIEANHPIAAEMQANLDRIQALQARNNELVVITQQQQGAFTELTALIEALTPSVAERIRELEARPRKSAKVPPAPRGQRDDSPAEGVKES